MKLNLDRLEARDVPATLFLNGGQGADVFEIREFGGGLVEVVANGRLTTHKGIDAIEGNFRAGNDVLTILQMGTNGDRAGRFKFDLGDGNDAAMIKIHGGIPWERGTSESTFLGGRGDDTFHIVIGSPQLPPPVTQLPPPVTVGGDLTNLIMGEAGNDSVWIDINNARFNGATLFEVDLGSGDNTLNFAMYKVDHKAPFLLNFLGGNGDDDISFVAQKVQGAGDFTASIDGGRGANRMTSVLEELTHNYTAMNFVALSGDGEDFHLLRMSDVYAARGGVHQETGRGADHVISELAHNYLPLGYEVFTEGGNDVADVEMIQENFMRFLVNVDLGDGHDVATVNLDVQASAPGQPTQLVAARVLGGAGNDTLTLHCEITLPPIAFMGKIDVDLLADGGADRDFVTVRGDYLGAFYGRVRVDLLGGSGSDTLQLFWPTSSHLIDFSALVDGGTGYDIARVPVQLLPDITFHSVEDVDLF